MDIAAGELLAIVTEKEALNVNWDAFVAALRKSVESAQHRLDICLRIETSFDTDRQKTLFPVVPPLKKERAKRRVLMHVCEGEEDADGKPAAKFECRKCGRKTDWIQMEASAAKRGLPCPTCNQE
jgi:DNA-directed RNA polymerase subunit RPC12/RpoP